MKNKELISRMIITFIEGVIAYLTAHFAFLAKAVDSGDGSLPKTALISLFSGGVAAGVSAAYNGIWKPWYDKKMKEPYSIDMFGDDMK